MKIIEKIEIKNFRSFGNRKKENFELVKIQDLNIISGANDSGKSNILRALNLFFNEHTTLNDFFSFEQDFFKKSTPDENDIKEELVTIKIHFHNAKNRGKNRSKPSNIFLPERFWVSRKFKRNSKYSSHTEDSSILTDFRKEKKDISYTESPNIKASLSKQLTDFIDSIQYHYIPAIKDKEYFSHLYGELQQTLWKAKTSSVLNTQKSFQEAIQNTTQALMNEFKAIVNSESTFAPLFELPQDLVDIFKTLSVNTGKVDLKLRGDGVQAKLIPEVLYFIALQEKKLTSTKIRPGQKAKKYFIWGFEEPENSYEYKNAQLLADRIKDFFAQEAQIFLTTHSFNFLSIKGDNVSTYRVWRDASIESSRIARIVNKLGNYTLENGHGNENADFLNEELGIFQLNEKLESIYLEIEAQKKLLKDKQKEIEEKISILNVPLLISEGKNKAYIEKAKEFFATSIVPFEILDQQELGDKEIEKLFNFLLKTQNKAPKKLFVVDCDSKDTYDRMKSKETEYLKPFIFEKNNDNTKVKKGIENLFSVDLFTERFYPEKQTEDEYGATKTIQCFDKNAFEKYICEEIGATREIFGNFELLFNEIQGYFGEI